MSESSVCWYVGSPQTGKTTLAWADAKAIAAEALYPILVVDSQGCCEKLTSLPLVGSVRDAARDVFLRRVSARVIPPDLESVCGLFRAAVAARHAIVLLDEAAFWLSGQHVPPALSRALRAHYHAKLHILLTTQHVGDIAPSAVQCATRLEVFRSHSPRAVKRLQAEYGLDPDEVRSLAVGEHLTISL